MWGQRRTLDSGAIWRTDRRRKKPNPREPGAPSPAAEGDGDALSAPLHAAPSSSDSDEFSSSAGRPDPASPPSCRRREAPPRRRHHVVPGARPCVGAALLLPCLRPPVLQLSPLRPLPVRPIPVPGLRHWAAAPLAGGLQGRPLRQLRRLLRPLPRSRAQPHLRPVREVQRDAGGGSGRLPGPPDAGSEDTRDAGRRHRFPGARVGVQRHLRLRRRVFLVRRRCLRPR